MVKEVFEIFEISGFTNGLLSLCRQPDCEVNYQKIDQWEPSIVVTLTNESEFPTTGPSLPQRFLRTSYDWLHLPITDFGVPKSKDQDLWDAALKQLSVTLGNNGRVLVHCKGGQGRSGMLLLKLLVLQGEDDRNALKRIRIIRPNAVETDAQHEWAIKAL